jgi:hypothetical protein
MKTNIERTNEVLQSVLNERKRQDSKWGVQDHSLDRWVTILGEEFGELCEAVLETGFSFSSKSSEEMLRNIKSEAIQVAAVAVAMLECIGRSSDKKPMYNGTELVFIPDIDDE